MKTYVISLPDCVYAFARFDFEAADWQGTNDLSNAWTIEAESVSEAIWAFRKCFGIDKTTFLTATLLFKTVNI